MATTTNFGWETPDDTDLVKDGAAAIRTALGGVDTSFVDLKGGTTNQVLRKATNTDLDFVWSTLSAAAPNSATSSYISNSTSSGTYVSGATPVSVTLTTGTKALVSIGVSPIFGNHQGTMSFRVTGASSFSAIDEYAVSVFNAASVQLGAGHTVLLTGLTAGSNTFELMYKSGSGTNNFQLSHIAVIDMGS